jgi:hypothetical protein
LVFTASRYGSFPIFHSDADLYLLDLKTGRRERLALNSDRADGYHTWSSNNRWLVFSSKREDTQFTRLYISHIDSMGHTSKAFILPQKDPLFYDSYLEIYNVPELIKEPVRISPQTLAKAEYSDASVAQLDSSVIRRIAAERAQANPSAGIQILPKGKKQSLNKK